MCIYVILISWQLSAGQNIYTSNIAGVNWVLLRNLLQVLPALDLSPAGGHCPWDPLFKAPPLAVDMPLSMSVCVRSVLKSLNVKSAKGIVAACRFLTKDSSYLLSLSLLRNSHITRMRLWVLHCSPITWALNVISALSPGLAKDIMDGR